MKRFLILLLLICATARAQVITTVVTLTNASGTIGLETISINGHLRTWTNNVTSAANQIAQTNTFAAATTNLFYSYVSYPEPNVNVFLTSPSNITFRSFVGSPLVVAFNGGGTQWAIQSSTTAATTNLGVFRGFFSQVGAYEQTNTANGIYSFLNSAADTNAFTSNSAIMSNFLTKVAFAGSLAGMTNYASNLSVLATNYTLTASNNLYTFIVSATNGIGASAYHVDTYYQTHTANLDGWSMHNVSELAGLSYLSGNDIVLANPTGPTTRFNAVQSGQLSMYYEDGSTTIFSAGTDGHVVINDHTGTTRLDIEGTGPTTLAAAGGTVGLTVSQISANVLLAMPVVFGQTEWPATAVGTVTNLLTDAPNSGTSETAVNQFNIPANTMTNIGDTLIRTISLSFGATGSYEVKLYFASDTIFDSGTITVASTATMSITAEVSLDSTSSFRSNTHAEGEGLSQNLYARPSSGNSIDFTSAQLCKIGIKGPASSDVKVTMDNTRLAPSPVWATLH